MKLIALKDFSRVQALEGITIENSQHDRHIHKGAEFDIGGGKSLKDLTVSDRVLVASLVVSGSVGDASDTKVVKAVKEEVALDEKREKNAAKLSAAVSQTALVDQLTALLSKAAASTPAK